MTEAAASVLPMKVGKPTSGRSRSSFSPDMLGEFCAGIGEALTDLFAAKAIVSLESVGVERFGDLLEGLSNPVNAAVTELNGAQNAALICFDAGIVFHAVDILLGGNAETDIQPSERPASTLDDRFCKTLANAVIVAFGDACDQMIGPGAFTSGSVSMIQHQKQSLDIAPSKADALSVRMAVTIGQAGRAGSIDFHLPLRTVDMICGGGSAKTAQPFTESGPWFTHMQNSILEMELEMLGVLHTQPMSVAELSRLDVGKVIPLPKNVIAEVPLVLDDGDLISKGELGASSGRRAVRLADVPNEEFFGPLRDLVETISS